MTSFGTRSPVYPELCRRVCLPALLCALCVSSSAPSALNLDSSMYSSASATPTRSSLAPPESDTISLPLLLQTPDTTHQCSVPCPFDIPTAHAGPSSPAASPSLPAACSRASAL